MDRELYWNCIREEVLYTLYNFPEENNEMSFIKYSVLKMLSQILESEEIFMNFIEIFEQNSNKICKRLLKRKF